MGIWRSPASTLVRLKPKHFCHILPYFTIFYHILPYFAIFCHILPYFAIFCHILPYFAIYLPFIWHLIVIYFLFTCIFNRKIGPLLCFDRHGWQRSGPFCVTSFEIIITSLFKYIPCDFLYIFSTSTHQS
jgi:hypothetical protein